MIVMSIDQSLSCSGITIWEQDLLVYFEAFKTPPKEEVILRLRAIMLQLQRLITRYEVKHIVIESLPYGANSTSVRPLAALYYFIANLAADNSIPFSESHVTQCKKLATGSGKASKKEMIQATLEADEVTYNKFVSANMKLTTGLADLCDSYWIYQQHKRKN